METQCKCNFLPFIVGKGRENLATSIILFFLFSFWGCSQASSLVKPKRLDPHFSFEALKNQTILVLPFRNTSGIDSDYENLEKIFLGIAKDKFPFSNWISYQTINNMEIEIGALNAWIVFLNKYRDSGIMKTKNIKNAFLEPQNIDYVLTVSLMDHRGGLQGQGYEYYTSFQFWNVRKESFAFECELENAIEFEYFSESFNEARNKIFQQAFSQMMNEVPSVIEK